MQPAFAPSFVATVNALNTAAATNATTPVAPTLVLSRGGGNATSVVTRVPNCNEPCMLAIASDIDVASLANHTIVNATSDELFSTAPIPTIGMGISVRLPRQQLVSSLLSFIALDFEYLNIVIPGSQEFQIATPDPSAPGGLHFYAKFLYPTQCPGVCNAAPGDSEFLFLAATECENGLMNAIDYRGVQVLAGYACVSILGGGLSVKIDHTDILNQDVISARAMAEYQNAVRYANSTTEVIIAKKNPGVHVAVTAADYTYITTLKFASSCPNNTCTHTAPAVIAALADQTGYSSGIDYRGVEVMAGYTYDAGLGFSVVVQQDTSEAQHNPTTLAVELAGCTVAAGIVSMLLLALLANVLLRSMDRAWDEGKRALERERQAFRDVIEAMYPAQVAQKMLTGETKIAYTVPTTTVFFSDIFEFTATSNVVTAEELIQFLGYTFGTMDAIADHFHVYKVKTIGDAYLAISGLPGVEPLHQSAVMDMILFASCCAQVFSGRFKHPEAGAILDSVVINIVLKKKGPRQTEAAIAAGPTPKRPSLIDYGTAPLEVTKQPGYTPPVHCVMRYGIALGPVTAGVLPGKTPLFDVWGKTVNLASRMESTGQPGRIQVSEAVQKAVIAIPDQPFGFDAKHRVTCRGFGQVTAYFLSHSNVPPPKQLLVSLNIKPHLGRFFFENPVPHLKKGENSGSHHSSSSGPKAGSSDTHSSKASTVSGKDRKAAPSKKTVEVAMAVVV
jgi:class 3 adenylate cyclase